MITLITLTMRHLSLGTGMKPMLINEEQISAIRSEQPDDLDHDHGTIVHLRHGCSWLVMETPEEISALIRQANGYA